MSGSSGTPVVYTTRTLGLLAALAVAYFLLAKFGLALAVIHPSASPVWPPSGLALAAVLIWGHRVWPAIFLAALLANLSTWGPVHTSAAVAAGNTLEAVVGAWLLARFAGGTNAFSTPVGVVKFAAISFAAIAPISATIGVASLHAFGFAEHVRLAAMWITWWLGDLAGALVVTPFVVLWLGSGANRKLGRRQIGLYAVTCLVGLVAFSPMIEQTAGRGLLAFLAIAPLLLAALYGSQRDTATVAVILTAFAVWGTMAGTGPFARAALNEAFLLTLVFVISAVLPSLALSAEVGVGKRAENLLRTAHDALDEKVRERTAALAEANQALFAEVTRARQIEADNKRQHIQLVEAQRLANFGSWLWDVGSGKVTWSAQLFEIYGIAPEQFGGTVEAFLACVHPDDRVLVESKIEECLRSGTSFRLDERIVRPDGEVRYLNSIGEVIRNEAGAVVQVLGVCSDVTGQREAVTALHESERMLRRLIDGVHDYAIFMLDPEGRVVSWNAGAERITQYAPEEVLGRKFDHFYTDQDRDAEIPAEALENAAADGKHESNGWRMRKDGTRFWANAVIDAIRDDQGGLVGFAKITRDISEQREAALALEETRALLAQSQKMESIGQLTGGLAHDFNNLLMIIIGNMESVRRRLDTPRPEIPELKRYVDNALRGARRSASLTQRLLAFSRRQPLEPRPVSIAELVSGFVDLLRSTLGEQIELQVSFADELWRVYADPNQLENAILNLVVNARDAMPTGGRLSIEALNVDFGGPFAAERGDLASGEYVLLVVSDTGEGIDPEVVDRVFEPFVTTKELGEGTGLGLSQVYGFVKQSGGDVAIDSVPGKGTTVTIWLPRATQEQEAAAIEEQPVEATAETAGATVLVVEDDDDVRALSREYLTEMGHRVLEASRARDALDLLDAYPEIALLFTDIMLPGGMDGRQLTEEARRRRPDIQVLQTTAYSRNLARAGGPGGDVRVVAKPFTAETLAADVSTALGRPRGRVRVLVVEDEPLVRMTIVDDLTALGCRVEETSTAAGATEVLRRCGSSLDAAIIDLGLPDRKGDVLVSELRAELPDLPVVIASGYGATAIPASFRKDRMLRIIAKPYTSDQLQSALAELGVQCGRLAVATG